MHPFLVNYKLQNAKNILSIASGIEDFHRYLQMYEEKKFLISEFIINPSKLGSSRISKDVCQITTPWKYITQCMSHDEKILITGF